MNVNVYLITDQVRSIRESNVFTIVCHSVDGGSGQIGGGWSIIIKRNRDRTVVGMPRNVNARSFLFF